MKLGMTGLQFLFQGFQNDATITDENKELVVYGQTNLRYVYRGKDARHFNW